MTDASWFWNLTDEQICHGLNIVYDKSLQKLASMLVSCNFDRILMKLTYADEIDKLCN